MIYRIRHATTFCYSQPVHQSVMELRMRPRTDDRQRCLEFEVSLSPAANLRSYVDFLGNTVHHFDIPSKHEQLTIEACSIVERLAVPQLSSARGQYSWDELDRLAKQFDNWDWVHPSHFTEPTDRLRLLAEDLKIARRDDPATVLRDLNAGLSQAITYESRSTRVDSPIDECLQTRRGVCQDFAHIFVATARLVRIPCRYVSGHLFNRPGYHSSTEPNATHAWAEALLPNIGWIGFDPTNNCLAGDDHVRIAVGRDYADVPPTRGVFKGPAQTQMSVSVDVKPVTDER